MTCSTCGIDWRPEVRRCPVCGKPLAATDAPPGHPVMAEPGSGRLRPAGIVRARPDLTGFDPWAHDPDGPSLPQAEIPQGVGDDLASPESPSPASAAVDVADV